MLSEINQAYKDKYYVFSYTLSKKQKQESLLSYYSGLNLHILAAQGITGRICAQ